MTGTVVDPDTRMVVSTADYMALEGELLGSSMTWLNAYGQKMKAIREAGSPITVNLLSADDTPKVDNQPAVDPEYEAAVADAQPEFGETNANEGGVPAPPES